MGNVKVGCFSSVCTNWMTDIIHSFHQRYPDINIELYQGTYADVSYWIKNGIVDIGFLSLSSAGDLPIEPLYRDPLLCVVPKDYRKREDTPYMTPDEMQDQVFVSQMETTDADIAIFMKQNGLGNVRMDYHVVDDLSTIALVAAGLGIDEPINSPTFTIIQEYESGRLPLYHFDVYRIGDIEEMEEIGYDDYFFGQGICLIEWANLIEEILPDDLIRITIEKDLEKGFDYRRITVEGLDI